MKEERLREPSEERYRAIVIPRLKWGLFPSVKIWNPVRNFVRYRGELGELMRSRGKDRGNRWEVEVGVNSVVYKYIIRVRRYW